MIRSNASSRCWVLLLFSLWLFGTNFSNHEAVVVVKAFTPLDVHRMTSRVYIRNSVTFQPTGNEFCISSACASLSWYPRDSIVQKVVGLEVTPPPRRINPDCLEIGWEYPDNFCEFQVCAQVQTSCDIVPIRYKIPFPLDRGIDMQGMDDELYLQDGEIADSSFEVRQMARSLVEGVDDLYLAVFQLADWVTNNIEYSLASMGQPATQSASQVLESKWGKCDELTSLFISLTRAIGIPARFVSGYSYTNSELFKNQWGGHVWAEIGFPGIGWVPFDVTYGQYGYLDAGHITLNTSHDAKGSSVGYNAQGREFTLSTEELDIVVAPEVYSSLNSRTPLIELTLDAPYPDVGFHSAFLVVATVTNYQDYYVSTKLELAETAGTEMLSDPVENIALEPNETKQIYYLFRVTEERLRPGFTFEFPFSISSKLAGGTDKAASTIITVKEECDVYPPEFFYTTPEEQQDKKISSSSTSAGDDSRQEEFPQQEEQYQELAQEVFLSPNVERQVVADKDDLYTKYNKEATVLSLSTPYQEVGFGSAILLVATVHNSNEFARTNAQLTMSWPEGVHLLNANNDTTTLSVDPGDTQNVYYLFQIVDDKLESGFTYGFPFQISSECDDPNQNRNAIMSITVKDGAPVLSPQNLYQTFAR